MSIRKLKLNDLFKFMYYKCYYCRNTIFIIKEFDTNDYIKVQCYICKDNLEVFLNLPVQPIAYMQI